MQTQAFHSPYKDKTIEATPSSNWRRTGMRLTRYKLNNKLCKFSVRIMHNEQQHKSVKKTVLGRCLTKFSNHSAKLFLSSYEKHFARR